MPQSADHAVKRLLLLGGGHAHVYVMRSFGKAPPPARVTVISRTRFTPYSGMLPGLLAGSHTFEESHIDLAWLAQDTGCDFIAAEATRICPATRRVECADGSAFDYDMLAVDTGSTPAVNHVPGAREHALSVKPVDRFLAGWHTVQARILAGEHIRVAVVGGGAGSVELLLSLQHRLRIAAGDTTRFVLVTDQPDVLMDHNRTVRRIFRNILTARRIDVRLGRRVAGVEPNALRCEDGVQIETDAVLWVTGAASPPWIADAGLAIDSRGFIAVNDCLQSTSHPEVFAAGDVAAMVNHPRPKAGVFAVRQGPPLARNLRAALAGEALTPYKPQRVALALIGTGGRNAVASWGPFAARGTWVWRWKRYIDQRWMRGYLPPDTAR